MTNTKAYPAYKESGVEWLGEIPESWNELPLTSVAELKSVIGHENEELLSVYLDRGVIKFSDVGEKRTNVTSTDLSKYQLVEPGDFVLNNQQAWRGSVGVSDHRGIVSPAYLVLKLKSLNPIFANYYFRNGRAVSQFLVSSKGVGTIQRNLYWPSLKRATLALPSPAEQKAIADFLDDKVSKIDRAIAQKERLIELLQERKQIIIQNAVTKGLDPSVKMKDSGIEWIGQIPEHWLCLKVTQIFSKVGSGTTPQSGVSIYYADGEHNWLQTGDLTDGKIHTTSRRITDKAIRDYSSLKKFSTGDLVIAMYGATIGKLGLLKIDTYTNQACCVLRPSIKITDVYGFLLLRGFRDKIISLSYGGGQPNISQDLIKSLRFPVPPRKEQQRVVEFVRSQSDRITASLARLQQSIQTLREYKATLIDSAVTGKIDVRDYSSSS